MKKILALSLSVLLCTGVFAGGTDNTSGASGVAVIKKDADTYKLIYKAVKAGGVRVSIFDAKHQVVFQESIKTQEGFVRPYNFGSLAEGDYTIEVVDASGKQVEKIHNVFEKNRKQFQLRKVKGEEKIVLSVSGKGTEKINVRVYDALDNVIYNEDKTISGDFAQVYNLKNIKGGFTMEVNGENGETKTLQYQ